MNPGEIVDHAFECYILVIRPAGVRTWREWFFETFIRGGPFSIRLLPTNQAERQQQAEQKITPPEEITRLNLNAILPPFSCRRVK